MPSVNSIFCSVPEQQAPTTSRYVVSAAILAVTCALSASADLEAAPRKLPDDGRQADRSGLHASLRRGGQPRSVRCQATSDSSRLCNGGARMRPMAGPMSPSPFPPRLRRKSSGRQLASRRICRSAAYDLRYHCDPRQQKPDLKKIEKLKADAAAAPTGKEFREEISRNSISIAATPARSSAGSPIS